MIQEIADSADELDRADMYVAIADFEAAESTNISLTAGLYVHVSVCLCVYSYESTYKILSLSLLPSSIPLSLPPSLPLSLSPSLPPSSS